MPKKLSFLAFLALVFCQNTAGQSPVIRIKNPSFEGTPTTGMINSQMPRDWFDCGFPGETAPDVHPTSPVPSFDVTQRPLDGETYLGLITRENSTWEAIGQQLSSPLQAGVCYNFSIYLCRSPFYMSPTWWNPGTLVNFVNPSILRIWGGSKSCAREELLAESTPVHNFEWQPYFFKFRPFESHSHLLIEAFYEISGTYSAGNILLDHASHIYEDSTCAEPSLFEFTRPMMGTEFRILLYAYDSLEALQSAMLAFRRVVELEKIFSDYRENSEVSVLNEKAGNKQWVNPSPEFIHLTRLAIGISKETDGAFDVSIGALTRLWRKAFRQQQFPDGEEIKAAAKTVGYRHIEFDKENKAIRLLTPGMRLDFGGIAKGYAVDQALRELQKMGIHSALVDGGGDIAAGSAPPGKDGWTIEYTAPGKNGPEKATVLIKNVAVATSGDTYRYLEWEGKRYSHIIDPRTGMGLTKRRIVTVFAPDCTQADAMATAISVGISDRLQKKLEKGGFWISTVEE